MILVPAVLFLAGSYLVVAGIVRWIKLGPKPEPSPLRASTLDRERAVDQLGAHWRAGRLTVGQLETRVGIALAAGWAHELEHVLHDLPVPGPERYRPWLRAAAAYNLCWGALTVLVPWWIAAVADTHGNLVAWQCIGMLVLVFAPAYRWAARFPERHAHVVAIALAGKTLGILGFLWALAVGVLPLRFGLVTLANDVIWVPAFLGYLRAAARERGGWHVLLSGA